MEKKYVSPLFTLYELKEGVYAAIGKEGTGSNAGLIDMGDFTVLFDTFLNIDATEALMEVSKRLTRKDIRYVINSHFHTDHIAGNSLFQNGTTIISSGSAREEICKMEKEFQSEKGQYADRIKEVEAQIKTGAGGDQLANLNNELLFLKNLVKPGVGIYAPNLSFEREITIYGNSRSMRLLAYEKAHSTGDVAAYLPEDGVCFMGDLLFTGSHPWLGGGDPEQFIWVLEELLGLKISQYVPGHGQLALKEDVLLQIRYIKELLSLVQEGSWTEDRRPAIEALSPEFREWKSLCFSWNVDFLMERQKSSAGIDRKA